MYISVGFFSFLVLQITSMYVRPTRHNPVLTDLVLISYFYDGRRIVVVNINTIAIETNFGVLSTFYRKVFNQFLIEPPKAALFHKNYRLCNQLWKSIPQAALSSIFEFSFTLVESDRHASASCIVFSLML